MEWHCLEFGIAHVLLLKKGGPGAMVKEHLHFCPDVLGSNQPPRIIKCKGKAA
jgi:hypothetical protein